MEGFHELELRPHFSLRGGVLFVISDYDICNFVKMHVFSIFLNFIVLRFDKKYQKNNAIKAFMKIF